MASPELLRAIEALDEVGFCEGTVRPTERIAIMVPEGDVAAAEDSNFVDWLIEHGEPAPFGHGHETKLDPAVRHAIRLRARGKARVDGFDPVQVLDTIEQALSPRTHLDASLTDVIVYPPGGHFAAHKDTPSSPALVGTLVVCLPFPHRGGAFRVETDPPLYFNWGVPLGPDVLSWVAVFGDLDHAIEHVELGHRVTLVYSLFETDRPRVARDHERRLAQLRRVASTLVLPAEGPMMIACTRHVIGIDGPQPSSLSALRGADREIADVLVEAGFRVAVRTCVAARELNDALPRRRSSRALSPRCSTRGSNASCSPTRQRRSRVCRVRRRVRRRRRLSRPRGVDLAALDPRPGLGRELAVSQARGGDVAAYGRFRGRRLCWERGLRNVSLQAGRTRGDARPLTPRAVTSVRSVVQHRTHTAAQDVVGAQD